MKHMFLVANTDLPTIELAVNLALDKVKPSKSLRQTDLLRYSIVYGKATQVNRLFHSEIVIFLSPIAYRNNQDNINPLALGIMLGDPLNLGCVEGEAISKLDFVAKEDGLGFFLHTLEVKTMAKDIAKALKKKPDPAKSVRITDFDMVPTIINSAKSNTTFVDAFAKITYSVRDDLSRDRLKVAMIAWIKSGTGVDALEQKFVSILGKSSSKVQFLVDLFADGNAVGKNVRSAVRDVLNAVDRTTGKKNANINYDKIADTYKVSAYDLRYIASMSRKTDRLLIQSMESSLVHLQNMRQRYVET